MGGASYRTLKAPPPRSVLHAKGSQWLVPSDADAKISHDGGVLVYRGGEGIETITYRDPKSFDTITKTRPANPLKERASQIKREYIPKPVKDDSAILKHLSRACYFVAVIGTVGYFIWKMLEWRAM